MSTLISYRQEMLRKTIHMSSLWMVAAMAILSKTTNILLFGFLLSACIVTEYGNHKQWPPFTNTYGVLFNRMLRANEKQQETFHLSGAPYVIGAALISITLFPKIVAMTAFSVMLFADTAAALIGRKFGRRKFNGGTKSVEGSIAFFWVGYFVVLFFYFFYNQEFAFAVSGAIGVGLATFAEAYENRLHIDDNFSIPIVVGTAISLSLLL